MKCIIGSIPLMILLASVCGCGHGTNVTGKVIYKGRPVAYGSVIFLCSDKTARSGVIEPDGSYTIEDVPPGDVNIAVISRDPSKGRSVLRGQKPSQPGKNKAASSEKTAKQWFPLPSKFEDPKTSGLGYIVASDSAVHDIDLK